MDSSSTNNSLHPRRIMLWATQRSLSTILCQCLSFVPGMKIFCEPYSAAYQFGPECRPVDKDNKYDAPCLYHFSDERIQKATQSLTDENRNWFSADVCTYNWVKNQLENAHDPDAQVIFCKDFAFAITDHYDKIPEGFKHIFLIRNPYKVLVSHKHYCARMILQEANFDQVQYRDIPLRLKGTTCGFQDMSDLFAFIKRNHHDDPVVIDADDLQNHTSSILRQLLEDVIGVPYSNSFLSWEANPAVSKQWIMAKAYGLNSTAEEGPHTKAFTSTCIEKAKEPPSRESLTPDLVEVVDEAMPIYEELCKLRIKP